MLETKTVTSLTTPKSIDNPPEFEMLVKFVSRVQSFKNGSPHNVIAVHCKVYTGMSAFAYLLIVECANCKR